MGFFSLELADLVEEFVGVEIDTPGDQGGPSRTRSPAAGRTGSSWRGAAEELLPGLLERLDPKATTLILDPPRKGCEPATLELLQRLGLAQIIYVSCHPATLARDLNVLCGGGVFEVKKIVPLDMFPQTQHVECVADIRRKAALLP